MHNLVQLATRKWLEVHMQGSTWQKASLWIIATTFPNGDHKTWATYQALLPHARKVLSYILDEMEATLDQVLIVDKAL
jgi:hypothetical protein